MLQYITHRFVFYRIQILVRFGPEREMPNCKKGSPALVKLNLYCIQSSFEGCINGLGTDCLLLRCSDTEPAY